MQLYLGIDGGGSSTKCLLADHAGRVLAEGKAGPCVHLKDEQSIRHARVVLYQAVHNALVKAGLLDSVELEAAFFGVTGVAHPRVPTAAIYRRALEEQFQVGQVRVDHDARIALAGALPLTPGVIVIAGTGSMAFGINETGQEGRAGGWGYLLGDPGSAYEIGRQALEAVRREEDLMGDKTSLTPLVLSHLDLQGARDIPGMIYADPLPRVRIAGIGRLVEKAAGRGDEVAIEILEEAGAALGEMACAVLRRLGLEKNHPAVSGSGGVFDSREWIWRAFRAEVLRQYPQASVQPPRFPPLVGALLLAYRHREVPVTPALLEKLEASLPGISAAN
jgi:N-acetylglucosamine kinase-like BadF-type ATPase